MQRLQRNSNRRTNEPKSAKSSTGQPRAQRRGVGRSPPREPPRAGGLGEGGRDLPPSLSATLFLSEVLSGEGRRALGQATGLEPPG